MAPESRREARPRIVVAVLICALAALIPGAALASSSFPGTDPGESPRANTPNDPSFDRCEGDDDDTPGQECTSYFGEDFRLHGFSPDSANLLPLLPHSLVATPYLDCSQLDAQGRAANVAAGDPECAQIAGIRADTAWKYSTGSPDVTVAILDTGIRWQDTELVKKVHLNRAELPLPEGCSEYDCNGDGAFNVADYADDSRVSNTAGDSESDSILDGSDLIAAFSDGADADSNGYVDDIAGWDFFDDDNDPFDASSCCSANGHGTGRAKEALAETNNAQGGAGICPKCQLMPLRVWDSFVVPTDNYAMGVVYASQNGASVVEGAVGGLTNTRFARSAFRFADQRGVALMLVSSDINSANHNYPTNYNEAIYVAGSFPDTAPLDTCSGVGGIPGVDVLPIPDPPEEFAEGCEQLLGLLSDNLGIQASAQPPTTSFFRNSNLTQYGGKSDIVLMGSTGSENTGQSSGAAGLLASFGRQKFGEESPLTGNEIRQLLTMTAEDVLPANTGLVGLPDKASRGWDPHFGYGRVNLAAAMKRIDDGRIPPEAQLDAPDWFAPINLARVGPGGVPIEGRIASPHGAGVGDWRVEWACGQDAPDTAFDGNVLASGVGPRDGALGSIPKPLLQTLADTCNGSVSNDAGRPAGTLSEAWPANPYPSPDPERHAFQIRLTAEKAGDPSNIGRYRKTLHAYNDDGNLEGWPKPVGPGADADKLQTGSGGETSPRLFDLDGDNALDVLLPTSSGELHALHSDGTPVQSFNGGEPVQTERYALEQNHPVPGALSTPHETLRVPAIGDIAGDRRPEIIATAGEHVYAWKLDGSPVDGFPVGVDRALSDPCKPGAPHPCFDAADRAITTENHIKRGFLGSPAIADLDEDGRLDVVAAALDQHVYAWDGEGEPLPGFDPPVKLASEGADGAEIVTSPAIAQLDGEGPPEVIVSTNEVAPADPQPPGTIFDIFNTLVGSTTGNNPVYALHGDGTPVDGWPVQVGVLAGDLLPFVLPGHDSAVLDQDGDGDDEVSVSAATSITPGGSRLVDGDGTTVSSYVNAVNNSPDQGPIINLADYASIGDLSGSDTPVVVKGGLTLNGVVNLLAVNQNLPFSHVEQAWDPSSGAPVAGYPRATDDFQLLSQASIARVGPGEARQALVGTGLYQLHAYGPAGAEPAGWPKFTGGWLQATPAIGDADGDGKLDVTTVTREGWSFLWKTDVPTCEGSNSEWWTFHHDEHSWANYGHDGRPPGTPAGLEAVNAAGGATNLSWMAPGDDWLCGTAEKIEIRVSADPIDGPNDGAVAKELDATAGGGDDESASLSQAERGDARYAAVLYRDEAGNWGQLASVELPPVGIAPGPCDGGPNALLGDDGPNTLTGTNGPDRIRGLGGDDEIRGKRGPDCVGGDGGGDELHGGRGLDVIWGGEGDDEIFAVGGKNDVIHCGAGTDRVHAGFHDTVGASCENVTRGS